MQSSFIVQPFSGGSDLRDFISTVANDPAVEDLQIAVAWAKRSGLARVYHELETFRSRGGRVTLIIGISEGGATTQGLELAMGISDAAYIFFDPSGRTFHPKVYYATGSGLAYLMVGSHNMTAGGLYFNYEAGIVCRLDLHESTDQEMADSVLEYFDTLLSDVQVCVRLTPDSLRAVTDNPQYRIGNEDRARVPGTVEGESGVPENLDSDQASSADAGAPIVFGRSVHRKRGGVPLSGLAAQPMPSTANSSNAGIQSPVPPEKRWYKQLSGSDAQVAATPNTKVTGNLKLTRAGHPIDQVSYFRNDFFGSAIWASVPANRGTKEQAVVTFHVQIHGETLGSLNLNIDHAEYRVANQSNVPTWLHWGPQLTGLLKSDNRKGDYVTIERFPDGTYRLSIDSSPTGDFVA